MNSMKNGILKHPFSIWLFKNKISVSVLPFSVATLVYGIGLTLITKSLHPNIIAIIWVSLVTTYVCVTMLRGNTNNKTINKDKRKSLVICLHLLGYVYSLFFVDNKEVQFLLLTLSSSFFPLVALWECNVNRVIKNIDKLPRT